MDITVARRTSMDDETIKTYSRALAQVAAVVKSRLEKLDWGIMLP